MGFRVDLSITDTGLWAGSLEEVQRVAKAPGLRVPRPKPVAAGAEGLSAKLLSFFILGLLPSLLPTVPGPCGLHLLCSPELNSILLPFLSVAPAQPTLLTIKPTAGEE